MTHRRGFAKALDAAPIALAALLAAALLAPTPARAAEAAYIKLHPDFLVNLATTGRPHVLMATIEVMTREAGALEEIKHHFPALRNELILLLSDRKPGEIDTVEGREALRKEALAAVNAVLERETGAAPIEALYFTNFIIE